MVTLHFLCLLDFNCLSCCHLKQPVPFFKTIFGFSCLKMHPYSEYGAYCWLVKADGRHRGPFPSHACTHIMDISQLVWG